MDDEQQNTRLSNRIEALERKVKENQSSRLGSIKTLIEDYRKVQSGDIPSIPSATYMGIANAFLMPRLIVVFGSTIVAILAVVQLIVFFNQNTLIEQQNRIITEQTRINELEAVAQVHSLLGVDDLQSHQLGLLKSYSDVGYKLFVATASSSSKSGENARRVLSSNREFRNFGEIVELVDVFIAGHLNVLTDISDESYLNIEYYDISRNDYTPNNSGNKPEDTSPHILSRGLPRIQRELFLFSNLIVTSDVIKTLREDVKADKELLRILNDLQAKKHILSAARRLKIILFVYVRSDIFQLRQDSSNNSESINRVFDGINAALNAYCGLTNYLTVNRRTSDDLVNNLFSNMSKGEQQASYDSINLLFDGYCGPSIAETR